MKMSEQTSIDDVMDAYRKFDGKFGDRLLAPFEKKDNPPDIHTCMRIEKIGERYKVLRRQIYDLIEELR